MVLVYSVAISTILSAPCRLTMSSFYGCSVVEVRDYEANCYFMNGIRNRLHSIYIVLYCQLNLPHYRQRRIEYPTVPSVRRHSFSVIVDRQTNITVHVVLLVEQHLYYKSRYETAIVPYFTDRVEVNYFQISSYPVRFFALFCLLLLMLFIVTLSISLPKLTIWLDVWFIICIVFLKVVCISLVI